MDVMVGRDKETKVRSITIRLMATKHNIFTGFIVKGKSEIKKFGKKDENICMTSADAKKFEKHRLRFKF